jgi:hypothetical protein
LLSPGSNVKFVRPYLRYDLESAVELLVGERKEQFEFERAIRLMEFQTWIYWPGTNPNLPHIAGLMAAVLLLENIEDDIYFEEAALAQSLTDPDKPLSVDLSYKPDATLGRINILRSNEIYRGLHDYIFAARGGLQNLLYCPTPENFDAELVERREKADLVADLIDYQLRYAQYDCADSRCGTMRHAIFFRWWPTYNIRGRRGITAAGKSPSTKTLSRWAKEFELTAVFIYLNEWWGLSQIPEFGNCSGDFLSPLRAVARNVDELRRFFGAYAYVAETIEAAGGQSPVVIVPSTVPRVKIERTPFTEKELKVIADYSRNAVLMDK